MMTYDLTDKELDILREGLLRLMENTSKALRLVNSHEAKNSINCEYLQYKALLDKLCGKE